MPTQTHRDVIVAEATLDFGVSNAEINSLPDGDLCWCAPADFEDADYVEILAQITMGTTPTAGAPVEFYVGRHTTAGVRAGTDDLTLTDHGTEGTEADILRVIGALGPPIATISPDATTGVVYTASFRVWLPGVGFTLFVYNRTGAALGSSGHTVKAEGYGPVFQN